MRTILESPSTRISIVVILKIKLGLGLIINKKLARGPHFVGVSYR